MRLTRWIGRAIVVVTALLVLGWGGLALHFAADHGALANVLAAAWVLLGVGILVFVRPFGRKTLAFAIAVVVLFAWWSTIRPRNDRHWIADVARPAHAERNGDLLTFHNVRNFDYHSETDWEERWDTRTYDLSRLDHLDLFMAYWGSPSIAHTIMSWAFTDGQHLAISIETRKEVGESYDPIAGFFRQYELYYVVADERDVIRLRTNYRHEQVYLYPLRASRDRVRRMLLDYVQSINQLAEHAAFYNALTDNCTTTIRTHVKQIGAAAPWDWRLLVNGYADQMLYESGRIDTSRPFAELKAASLIDARAQAADQDPLFSRRIREGIVVPPLFPDTGGEPRWR